MKKFKVTVMCLAVLFSVCAAFTTRPKPQGTLYFYNGLGYENAGIEGVNFYCVTSYEVCTYYFQSGQYYPYQVDAQYIPFGLQKSQKPDAARYEPAAKKPK